jgi:hypothetical protein
VKTDDHGLATFEGLPPGRYSVQAEFPGFDLGLLRNLNVRRGDNRHVVVLTLKNISENVDVGAGQEAASTRSDSAFGQAMTADELATLSDDPTELQRQIMDFAGPDAVIRVDSFEGAQLPPKSQIKSVHVTRDQFAAEADRPGSTFVDIITQPGSGALSGGANFSFRNNALAGKSPFVGRSNPEVNRDFNGNLGGTLIKDRADFSLFVYGQNQYTTPILNQAGSPAEVLKLRQPNRFGEVGGQLNFALTRDQTMRVGYLKYGQHSSNQGVGILEGPEHAFSSDFTAYQFRIQEAGPIGRRIFHNTRLFLTGTDSESRSVTEAPTIVIQQERTMGGAQVRGGTRDTEFNFASDVDYIRGIHSWRAGILAVGSFYNSDADSNYLGTYTFADEASFEAGRPLQFTQSIGNPTVKYTNVQGGIYLQDDLRISKSLTLSPGVRYTLQTHVRDRGGIAPRFGTTWSPSKSGHTTIRFSAGIFYWYMEMARVYEQTLRFDGNHQQQVIVLNPSYPDPGAVEGLPPNKYVLGDYSLQRNLRYSAGVDHRFSPRFRVNVLYAYVHQFELWRGENLNAPVNGVRPNPDFANIVQTLTDGTTRRHDVTVSLNLSLFTPSPAANNARVNWRRLSVSAGYGTVHAFNNSDGPFTPPPSGTLDTEWGPGPGDLAYRLNVSLTSTQIRNLNVNLGWNTSAGQPYNETTGIDDNQDGFLNDRPAGIGLRSLRTTGNSTLNLRVNCNLTRGGAAGPAAGAQGRRYRVGLSFSVQNLTNHANYGGYSGVVTSSTFLQPTYVTNPRRADVGVNIGF